MAVATGQGRAARGRLRVRLDTPAGTWAVFAVLLALAFVYLMLKGRGNSFFYDEWTWLETRRNGLHSILDSYNEHLLALPIAVYQVLFHTVGLAHYWVYRLLETIAHLGCIAALFEFARRRLGRFALLVILPVLVLGTAWEYVLEGVNLGFVASIGLSIGALLCFERDDGRGDLLACLLLVAALACSEFAVVFALGLAVETWLRDRSARRIWVSLVPLALYGAWWLAYHEPSTAGHNITAAPAFAAELAANAMRGLLGLDVDWGRPLLVAALLILGWRSSKAGVLTPRLAGLLVAAGAFWLSIGLGRAQLGQPDAPRYIYAGAILIVLIGAESFRASAIGPRALVIGGLVSLFALAGNIHALGVGEDSLRTASRQVSAELTALQLVRARVPASFEIDSHYAPQIIAAPYFAAIDDLHSSSAYSVPELLRTSEFARTAADNVLIHAGEVTAGSGGKPKPGAQAPVIEGTAVGSANTNGSCVNFTRAGPGAALDLLLPAGGIIVRAAPGPQVQIRARRFASGYEGDPVATLGGGGSVSLRVARDSASQPWHVRVSSVQAVQACGL